MSGALTMWTVVVALFVPAELRKALEQYDFGEFEAACKQLETLRYNKTFDAEARLVTMKYLGACRHVVGDKHAAAAAFNDLLDLDRNAQLDPVQFPPDMVEFFGQVKARHAAARAKVPDAPPPPVVGPDPPPDASGRTSMAWAPFGVGQFQNGQRSKGTTLAVLQGISLGAGVLGLAVFEASKEEGTFLQGGEFRDTDRASALHSTYILGFTAFAGLWIYGIIDASVNARRSAWIAPTPDGLVVGGHW